MRPALALLLLATLGSSTAQVRYYGQELGALSQLQHGVRGTVYAVDSRTVYIRNFYYDGVGPAAYFFVGPSTSPRITGSSKLRDERGGAGPLRKYTGESITLTLPDGKTLKDFRWFSVYCEEYEVNFGDVAIPRGVEYPRPAKVGALRGAHGVRSDPIVVVDAQTLLIPNFSYDGEAPDAKFWVGRGEKPSPAGVRIPDENGKEAPLRRYDRKTIVLTLPGELSVFDVGHFGVWCEAFTVDFGHVQLPRAALAHVPPSLRMLGVSPQSRNRALVEGTTTAPPATRSRAPIARLDATTYRPPARLKPGASLLTSLSHDHQQRTNLQRRANTNQPPQEQSVTIQSSKELEYRDNEGIQKQTYQQQQTQLNQQQTQLLTPEQYYQQQVLQQQLFEKRPQQEQKQQPSEKLTPEQHYQQQNLQQHLLERNLQYKEQNQEQSEQLTPEQQYQQQLLQQQLLERQSHHDTQQYTEQSQQHSEGPAQEQNYQQLILQQQLLERELQERQQLLRQAQEQLYYSQRPQNLREHAQDRKQPQPPEQSEPDQYRLVPY